MSLLDKKCEGPYVKPCIEYADDRHNIRLYQWCAGCLRLFSERLNHQPLIVNTPIRFDVESFTELARRWRGLSIEDLRGKYYGTHVIDEDGAEVVEFWTASGEPSQREKQRFGPEWTPEAWATYCCDSHWECEADYQAAIQFVALAQAIAIRSERA